MTTIVRGFVQRAGFRDFIQQQAYRHRITGTVQNLKDGSVEIVAEGHDNQLAAFLRAVRKPPSPIEIENIVAQSSQATGEFQDFHVTWDTNEAIVEKLETGFRYAFTIISGRRFPIEHLLVLVRAVQIGRRRK